MTFFCLVFFSRLNSFCRRTCFTSYTQCRTQLVNLPELFSSLPSQKKRGKKNQISVDLETYGLWSPGVMKRCHKHTLHSFTIPWIICLPGLHYRSLPDNLRLLSPIEWIWRGRSGSVAIYLFIAPVLPETIYQQPYDSSAAPSWKTSTQNWTNKQKWCETDMEREDVAPILVHTKQKPIVMNIWTGYWHTTIWYLLIWELRNFKCL